MKAEEIQAGKLFGSDQQLQIPLWQRHYSWETPELAELWSDIVRVREHDLHSHFLGSVVLKKLPWAGLPSEARRFWVVDGQQRVTTLTVLVCAIRDRLAQAALTDDDRQNTLRQYTAQLLRNTNLQEGHQDRLVLQERDRASLGPIVSGTWDGTSATLVERAYVYFKRELSDYSAEDLQHLLSIILTRLSAVWVTLEEGDNAHRVFQTLNAGGKKLRQSDLVRNYFFLLLGESGDAFYDTHWRQMESDLTDRELDDYLVAWSISQGHSGSRDSLFSYFHKDLLPSEESVEAIRAYGETLASTARYFRWIRQPADSSYSASLKQTMTDLRNWTTQPAEGLLLWLMREHHESRIAAPDLQEGMEIVLSFMARRQAAGFEPNLHKSIFVGATRKLHAADLAGSDVIDYLRYILSTGDDVRTWPSDQVMSSGARTTPVYSAARSGWAFSLLERANRKMFNSAQHAPGPLDRARYSVEHVMPQTLTDAWGSDLQQWGVENPSQLHQTKLHVLGNLTLTPINSQLSNLPFATKRGMLGDDWLRLNAEIAATTTWTESRIDERSGQLAQLLCRAYVGPMSESEVAAARQRFLPEEEATTSLDMEAVEDGEDDGS